MAMQLHSFTIHPFIIHSSPFAHPPTFLLVFFGCSSEKRLFSRRRPEEVSKKTRRILIQGWSNVVKRGQTWTNMVKCGQKWTNMDKTGQIWSIVVKLIILFFYKFIIVYHSLCKKCPDLKPNYSP